MRTVNFRRHRTQTALYMKAGDVCEIVIESIGTLRNPIANEAR